MRVRFERILRTVVLTVLVCKLFVYGSTKPPVTPTIRVDYDRTYLYGVTANVDETDGNVVLTWTYSRYADEDTLHIEVRDKDSDAWATLYTGHIRGYAVDSDGLRAGSWAGPIENPFDKVFYLWVEYTPPVIVHTNGVYHLDGVLRPIDSEKENQFIIPSVEVKRLGTKDEEVQ